MKIWVKISNGGLDLTAFKVWSPNIYIVDAENSLQQNWSTDSKIKPKKLQLFCNTDCFDNVSKLLEMKLTTSGTNVNDVLEWQRERNLGLRWYAVLYVATFYFVFYVTSSGVRYRLEQCDSCEVLFNELSLWWLEIFWSVQSPFF